MGLSGPAAQYHARKGFVALQASLTLIIVTGSVPFYEEL